MDGNHRATLVLDAAVTSYESIDGNVTGHPQQHFLDFLLHGLSVREVAFDGYPLATPILDQRARMGGGRVPPPEERHTEVACRALDNARGRRSR